MATELRALHDGFVEVYMKQPSECGFSFFNGVAVPACESIASSRLWSKRAGKMPLHSATLHVNQGSHIVVVLCFDEIDSVQSPRVH